MKPIESLVKDNLKNFKPCVHGGQVLAAAEQTGLKPADILDFSSSVNPIGPSPKALDAITNNFWQIQKYPDSNSNQLREAIANHYGLNKDNIVIGNGSTELIYLFADAFMKKGDLAVIPAPSFDEYESAVRRTGEQVKFLKLNKNFQVEQATFAEDVSGAKIVFLCNPNNPTSILTSTEKLSWIIQTAMENSTLVFLDEDFLEFVENREKLTFMNKIKKYPNLFILKSFTKIYGLTGLRVGYGVACEELTNILLSSKIPWNVNCLAQSAAIAALNDEEHLKKTLKLIKEEKIFLLNELKQFKTFKIYPPDANYLFIDIRKSGLTAAQLKEKMLKRGILIRDCSSFAGLDEYFVRIAVKTRSENEKLLGALKEVYG